MLPPLHSNDTILTSNRSKISLRYGLLIVARLQTKLSKITKFLSPQTPPKQTRPNPAQHLPPPRALRPSGTPSCPPTPTAGPDLRELQGIVYVGTHPDGDERVLWFKLEHGPGADKRLYPTVYTLWHNPNLVPLLYTPEFVMGKLHGGADLMTPGLANEPPFPERAAKGAVVAGARVGKNKGPLFVGICEIDVSALGEVQGTKGHAVRGLHWEGDELWAWSSASLPGRPAPEYLEGWDEDETEGVEEVEEQMEDLGIADDGVTTTPGDIETTSNDLTALEEPVTEEETPTTDGMLSLLLSYQPVCDCNEIKY